MTDWVRLLAALEGVLALQAQKYCKWVQAVGFPLKI